MTPAPLTSACADLNGAEPDAVPPCVLEARGVRKRFVTSKGNAVEALDNINLEVRENDFVCIVGPSGCGKSTLLRMAAGLESIEGEGLLYRGEPISRPRREIGMVFQEYSLLPWRTVADNVSLGLEFARKTKKQRRQAAEEYLDLVNLRDFAHCLPHELSGGMRQRVAIARALANRPDVLLMDEPFGALDAHTRILLQKELLRIWEQRRTTIVFVTHGVDEAVFLADRVVVMSPRPGRIRAEVPVPLPRPRDRADPAYAGLAARILDMLEA